MPLERFFLERAPEGGTARLSRDEAHHLRDVRRLGIGADVVLFDGSGSDYFGRVVAFDRAGAVVEIIRVEQSPREATAAVTLAVSIVKRRAMDQLVDQCTQLGVARLIPMRSGRSVVRTGADQRARWLRIAIEACKQCGRSRLPDIEDERPFSAVLAEASPYDLRCIASLRPGARAVSEAVLESPRTVLCLIGPEGGFTSEEEAAAEAAGCLPLWLGPHILRTETAAAAALALITQLCRRAPADP